MAFNAYLNAVKKNDVKFAKENYRDEYLAKLDENDMTVFLHACNLGYIDMTKFFLEKNVHIETACPYNEWRALHWAVGNGYAELGKLLIDHGADKESKTSRGMHPIHCATAGNHFDAVRMLLVNGVDLNSKNMEGETALEMAIDSECYETTQVLNKWIGYDKVFNLARQHQLAAFQEAFIKERVLVKEVQTNLTILDVAVQAKSFDCLEFVFLQDIAENDFLKGLGSTLVSLRLPNQFLPEFRLYRSILLEKKDEFNENATVWNTNQPWILTGESFLEICCRYNRLIFVVPLLQMQMEINDSWEKAAQVADNRGHAKVAHAIRSRREFVKNRTKVSYNRLHIAVQDNNTEVIKYILANGLVDPNEHGAVLGSPLCLALSLGHLESVEALKQFDIDVDKTNKFKQTPLHISIESKMVHQSLEFLNQTNQVDNKDCYGFTPLHLAVINNNMKLCELLIQKGADVFMPLSIQQASHLKNIFASSMTPLCAMENPLTLCMKLHRTIYSSIVAKITDETCNSISDDGNSLLHISSKLLIPIPTKTLISKGSNVNLINAHGNTPLHSAFLESMENSWETEGFMETVSILVSHGADINLLNNNGISPFRCAIDTNSKNTLNAILNQCHRVDVTIDDIFKLYQRQWPDLLKIVLDLQNHEFKQHLLVTYITESQLELVEFILEFCQGEFIQSALDELLFTAANLGREDIFDKLLTHYTACEPKLMSNGETVLTNIILNSDEKYPLAFCKGEYDSSLLDMKNKISQTPLYVAALKGYIKLFKYLVINCQSTEDEYEGATALEKLMDTFGNNCDKKKLDKIEAIIKIMMKQGFDVYKSRNNNCNLMSRISNEALKVRLTNFCCKLGQKRKTTDRHEDEDRYLCEICLENPMNCVFVDCGHPICRECADKVQMCPKCRKPKCQLISLYI